MPIFHAELADHPHFDLERISILSVSESKPKKNKKSCVLTDSGRKKLNQALGKQYSKGYKIVELAEGAGINRDTISNILSKEPKPVTWKCLNELFSFLGIDLEESDFENPPKNQVLMGSQNPSQVLQKSDDFILLTSNSEKLKNALWKLNYFNQQNLFDDAISQVKPAAAFLIHGKPNYGQSWLVNLLKYKVPYHTDAWQKGIYIKPHRKDIQTLWQSLANELKTDPSAEAVVKELYQHWQTRTVIIALHDVDLIAGSCLQQFINELWQPLVARVNGVPLPQRRHRIVLFLVDNKNSKLKLETSISLGGKPDRNKPHIPLALQEIEPFNQDLIETWVGVQSELLSQLWESLEPIEKVMGEIIERDNQPISVLKDICQCFELNWEQDIAGKLAL